MINLIQIFCASLLPIISRVIGTRTLKRGGFCLKAGVRLRGKLSFSQM